MQVQALGGIQRPVAVLTGLLIGLLWFGAVQATAINPAAPPSLKTVPVPEPPDLARYVKNRQSAIVLGKALFWDMQAGSDGVQTCGSCHFYAGTEVRRKNSLAPGGQNVVNPTFDPQHGGAPNYTLSADDFPFHQLENPADRFSKVLRDSDDIVAPQGISLYQDQGYLPGNLVDFRRWEYDPIFSVTGINVRRSEPRRVRPITDAVFNYRNLWDGRASNIFNGVNFSGAGTGAKIWIAARNGKLQQEAVNIDFSSLASQAVAPPVANSLEMSYAGRKFPDIGKRMLSVQPLALQQVSRMDSVLGPYVSPRGRGLCTDYAALIQRVFPAKYWQSDWIITYDANGTPSAYRYPPSHQLGANEYTLMQANFSFFWGLAIQMYVSTLVSDHTPFDAFQEGNTQALTAQQQEGLTLFLGNCADCHGGSLFTNAAVDHLAVSGLIERRQMHDGGFAVADVGFLNTSVRKTEEDIAVGGNDPFGRPFSLAARATLGDPIGLTLTPPVQPGERINVDGAFKVPGLRNVALRAPVFHNGGNLTLTQAVEFYNRGGDFNEHNAANMPFDFDNLNLNESQIDAIVAFLNALTDPRVLYQRAPFDHPEIYVPDGAVGNTEFVVPIDGIRTAQDRFLHIPAVGASGGPPLQPVY